MSEIRTAAEAIKAVVAITRRCVYHDSAGIGFDEEAFEAAIRALPVAEAPNDEALAWRPGSETPAIPSGDYAYFIVVVRRAQARANRQVFTFPACYLNAYPLEWNGGEGCGECPEDGSHANGCPMTGWFDCRFSSDYDYYYEQLLSVGDEVLEWAAIPDRGAALREAGALR